MNLEDLTWKEVVSKLEKKFKERFGTHCVGGVQTYGGTLHFTNGRLKITVSDVYDESHQDVDIDSHFDHSSLTYSLVEDLEKLFLCGIKNEENKRKEKKQALEKLNSFLNKEF